MGNFKTIIIKSPQIRRSRGGAGPDLLAPPCPPSGGSLREGRQRARGTWGVGECCWGIVLPRANNSKDVPARGLVFCSQRRWHQTLKEGETTAPR